MILKKLLRKFFPLSTESKEEFFHNNLELIEKIPKVDYLHYECVKNSVSFLRYLPNENMMLFKTKEGTILKTDMYYWIMSQMFFQKLYKFPSQWRHDKYAVFDIGMNRGYSTLWFAQDKNCKAVYCFEVDKDIYDFAIENFRLNPKLKEKIKPFDFGLSNHDDYNCKLTYIPGEDSVTTIEKKFVSDYYSPERKERLKKKPAILRKTSSIFKEIFKKGKITVPLVLKIDVEGAEYDIFDDLNESKLLSKFSLIMGECHYGMEGINTRLKDFKLVESEKITDQLYNFCYVNKKTK